MIGQNPARAEGQGPETACADQIGSCEYYQCREREHSCGERGYYLGFGYRICRASFEDVSPSVSEAGQGWLRRVATCLQQEMEAIPTGEACPKVKRQAVDGHAQCYLATGFCDLPFSDQVTILSLIGREVVHPGVLNQGLHVLAGCWAAQPTSSPLSRF